jgi:hypothetical protein
MYLQSNDRSGDLTQALTPLSAPVHQNTPALYGGRTRVDVNFFTGCYPQVESTVTEQALRQQVQKYAQRAKLDLVVLVVGPVIAAKVERGVQTHSRKASRAPVARPLLPLLKV